MIFCEPANIFRGASNDYNIRVMNCKKTVNAYIRAIALVIKKETGIDPFEKTTYRKRDYVLSRQLFMVMLYNSKNGGSMKYSASILGKNHATLSYSRKTIDDLMDTDKSFCELYHRIEKQIKLLQ